MFHVKHLPNLEEGLTPPLPHMARKVAHPAYTVLCNFMQRMAY